MTPSLFSALRTLRPLFALSASGEGRLCGESLFPLGFTPCSSSIESARPSHPATSANPRAATGSTPGPQATSRPSGTADNNWSHSTHTGSSESSFRTVCTAIQNGREQTSPPGTRSPFPEIFRALPRAVFSSRMSASLESPDTSGQSLPMASAASAKLVKAAHEKVFHRNTRFRFR